VSGPRSSEAVLGDADRVGAGDGQPGEYEAAGESLSTARVRPVVSLVTVMCAPLTAACDGSVTVPCSATVSGVCAAREAEQSVAIHNTVARNRDLCLHPKLSVRFFLR
jgi:hypothetical protein